MKDKIFNADKKIFSIFSLLLFSVLNMLYMHYYIFFNHYIEDILLFYIYVNNLLMVFFDVSVIFLLFCIISFGKLKLSLFLTFILTWGWSFVNVFYIRFFNQYLSLSALGQIGQLGDQAVLNSMMAGFQWSDLYYPMSFVVFFYVYLRVPFFAITRRFLFVLFFIPVFSFISTFAVYGVYHMIKAETRNNSLLFQKRMHGLLYTDSRNAYPNATRFGAGSIRVILGEILDLASKYELTNEQRDEIENEYSDMRQRITDHTPNKNIKNVVFILLESFLSAPIDLRIDGKEITPFLNSLKRSSDTYYNGHVMPNITIGESGDGQFIYMTGILPLRDKLTVGEAKTLSLPSLPKVLAKHLGIVYSEIIMPSPPQVWEQEHMNKVYGINKMYCNRDVLGKVTDYLDDEDVFTLAINSPAFQKQPFFSMVLNYSTHQPYRKPVDNSFVLRDKSIPDSYKNYLISCHYADMWLSRYFRHLKDKGVYDNSLIVITADHHAHLDALGMNDSLKKELPLFIINGDINTNEAWTGTMNQLDVYTTLLDLLGVKATWHGLGHSILNKEYKNSLTEKAWLISEWIVKGQFFGVLGYSKQSD